MIPPDTVSVNERCDQRHSESLDDVYDNASSEC